MSLETLNLLGLSGGQKKALSELQGLTMNVVAGVAADTNLVIPGITTEDTVVLGLNNNAGTITDITSGLVIADGRAFGTIALAGVTAADTVTVNALTYTAVSGAPADNTEFDISGDDTADAESLRDAINSRDGSTLLATSDTGTVTVTALDAGVAGNAIGMSESTGGVRMTLSGANLANGTGDFADQTIQCASVVAGDWVKIRGKMYTAIANGAGTTGKFDEFEIGASNNDCAANLAAAINGRDPHYLTASVNTDTVTVKFNQMTAKGNNVKLETSGATIVLGGATLTGGVAPGGAVRHTSATNQLILFWFDKR